MTDQQEIVNPDFVSKTSSFMECKNMVRCNKSANVYKFIKTGKNYVIEFPNTNTILNVTCTFAAIRAADMKIITAYVDGKRDCDSEDCTVSYQYENFDQMHYTSFAYREKCIVYMSIDDAF
jgi:hypothetical protein